MSYLPVWISVLDEVRPGQQRVHAVAAVDALVLPGGDSFFPELTPAHIKYRIVQETPKAQQLIEQLGGSVLSRGTYAINYVCPHLARSLPPHVLLETICTFVQHLVDHLEPYDYVFKSNALIADRTGRLRYGRDLYESTHPIFSVAFEGNDDKFPHTLFQNLPLDQFGVQKSVTTDNFIRCVDNLELEYMTDETDREAIRTRCMKLWRNVNQLTFSEHFWLRRNSMANLANCHFVPVLIPTPTIPSYRHEFMRRLIGSNLVSNMNNVLSPEFLPIAWTQRIFATHPPAPFLEDFGFAPAIADVVEHLVTLSTEFAARCSIKETLFFEDLVKTYDYLNHEDRLREASAYLLQHHCEDKVWLNEDLSFFGVSKFTKAGITSDAPISSLMWLSAGSILHGVPYDLPNNDLYSAKSSMEPYRNLLRECGSKVVENVKVAIKAENIENHGNYMLGRIREMMEKHGNGYDMKITIQKQEYFAHRVLLAAISPYFSRLCYGDWKEKSTGELDLDAKTYGTADSVGSVIEWVYNGYLKLDDGLLPEDEVPGRLQHYLSILELTNVWDIPALRVHIENRILKYAGKFIRVENVSVVLDMAKDYNANDLEEFCEDFIDKNKRVVELVENSPEPE